MYKEHFGLKELPFSISPDPRYLFLSDQHREALAHLVYGISSDGGFVLLTGEVGTGKTTVCRCLLEQTPEYPDIAFILNPKVSVEELLASFCDELGISYPEGNKSIKVFVDRINTYLLDAYAKGRKTVMIIEEAQNLTPDVLEQIRLLTNLETNQQKLLQIIMVGQPELRDMLSEPELLQLSQRITARYHIGPLSRGEVGDYVTHRLTIAGTSNKLFPDSIIGKLYHLSGGVPRLINVICDRALLGTYVQGRDTVNKKTLIRAAREVLGENYIPVNSKKTLRWAVIGFVLIISLAALAAMRYNRESQQLITQKVSTSPVVSGPEIRKEDTLQGNSDYSVERSKYLAFQALFETWRIPYKNQGNNNACRLAQAYGLQCLNNPCSFNALIRLNRPAVLKLLDAKGKGFYALFKSLKDRSATLVIGNETRTIDIREIEKRWFGEYILLWRAPQNYQGSMHPGYQGHLVEWLDRQVTLASGLKYQPRTNLTYDDELVSQVKQYQLSEGLIPDGIVGPQTIIHLNTTIESNEPLLSMIKGEMK